MTREDAIIQDLSLRNSKQKWVIDAIVNHPFLFAKRRMEDPDDLRPIMIVHFGKFVPKYGTTLESKRINTEKHFARKSNSSAKKNKVDGTTTF